MKNPEIKPGQIWETRSGPGRVGQRVKIDAVLPNHGNTPVKSENSYWQTNGRYWSDEHEHSKDLIKLISQS